MGSKENKIEYNGRKGGGNETNRRYPADEYPAEPVLSGGSAPVHGRYGKPSGKHGHKKEE
jgi:hypothetical protein